MITRRTVLSRASLAAAGAIAAPAILHWPAYAAEFAYKCGTALPDGHPLCIRGREAAAKIKPCTVWSNETCVAIARPAGREHARIQ